MKNSIASAQAQIDQLNESIHYAPSNCVSGCTQWNERQQQKQQQVESMKSQLEEMRKQMEDMQETARQQGYGSAVYDP
jgi:DNA repair exonuclease SbcCD ATPase subunit